MEKHVGPGPNIERWDYRASKRVANAGQSIPPPSSLTFYSGVEGFSLYPLVRLAFPKESLWAISGP